MSFCKSVWPCRTLEDSIKLMKQINMVLSQVGFKRRLYPSLFAPYFLNILIWASKLPVACSYCKGKKKTNQEGNFLSTLKQSFFPGFVLLFNFTVLWGTGDWQVQETGYRVEWVKHRDFSGACWKCLCALWLIDYQI